ncbi:MAG: gliding motility lipoprotein GldB [Bacteroidia bacterium]|nr:gliding motility lipoprotein GldB [Bacteroidia bacterium]
MIKYLFFALVGLALLLSACSDTETCQDLVNMADISLDLKIVRLEQTFFQLKSRDQIKKLLADHPQFAEEYMHRSRLPSDTIPVDQIFSLINEPYMDTVYQDVQAKFRDITQLKEAFEQAFKHIKFYYPDFKPPKIYTVITGLGAYFGSDLYVSRDLIVVSLEFFLGTGARYRPPVEQLPDYVWRRYHPQSIVPTCMLVLSNAFNQTDLLDKSILAEMIYFGKSYYFVEKMMPCLPDSILTGYTAEELANINNAENRNYLWNHFIHKQVLFSTREESKRIYLNERPYVAEINNKVPGRIGRWFGWRIVQKYMERNPKVSLPELMANPMPANFQSIRLSGRLSVGMSRRQV